MVRISAVQDQSIRQVSIFDCIGIIERLHHLFRISSIDRRILFSHGFNHLQHTAGRNGCRRRIPGLVIPIRELQIPEGYHVLGQMLQIILRYMFEDINILFSLCVLISQGTAIDTPRLPSRPGRTVPIPLTGSSMVRRPCFHIKKEGMPGRIVLPDDICNGRMNMFLCDISILCIPGLLRRPVQEGKIQQTVNDQSVIFRRIHGTPCLNKFSHRMIPGN